MRWPALLMLVPCVSACAASPPAGPPPPARAVSCPIIGSSDWAAWINATPGGSSRPTLIVTGKVTVPSGGWDFIWRTRVMESYPVQVAIDLEPLIPEGATQAVMTRELRHEMPLEAPVGSLTISCGGAVLARIAPVETVH